MIQSNNQLASLTIKILLNKVETQEFRMLNWSEFSDFLIQNKLFLPVISNIKKRNVLIPDEIRHIYVKKRLLQSLLISESEKIVSLLRENNISVIPIKGHSLSKYIYNSDTSRDYGDIDLLIRKEDFLNSRELLLISKYQAFAYSRLQFYFELFCMHSVEFNKENGISLDLHWGLAQRFYLAPEFTNDFISNSIENTSPEYILCSLAIQSAKEKWNTLGTLWDCHNLLLKFPDFEKASLQLARKYGFQKLLEITLNHVKTIEHYTFHSISDFQIISLSNQTIYSKFKAYFIRYFLPFNDDWKIVSLPNSFFFIYFLIKPVKSFLNLIMQLLRIKN